MRRGEGTGGGEEETFSRNAIHTVIHSTLGSSRPPGMLDIKALHGFNVKMGRNGLHKIHEMLRIAIITLVREGIG